MVYRESGIEGKTEGLLRALSAARGTPEEGRLRVELAEARALLDPTPGGRRLARVRVAAPCVAEWDAMAGDERVRFCAGCQQNVYNLSAMTRAQAEALLSDEGRTPCVRFYRRADGTVLTSDCPVGVRQRRPRWAMRAGAALVSVAVPLVIHLAVEEFDRGLRVTMRETRAVRSDRPVLHQPMPPWPHSHCSLCYHRGRK